MDLSDNVKRLQNIAAMLPGRLNQIAKNSTIRAIEKAAEMTPSTQDDISGTNTRSGGMKESWATSSKAEPMGGALSGGKEFHTILANDKEYASYVNDGHRMDRHFVPGLYINPHSGMLEYAPGADVGIVVGTKTAYVPGLFMVDEAKKVYEETVKTESAKLEELFK